MDIFEYIDRVKANFDKKPEPRYNMKKYFMGGSVTTPKRGLVDEPGSYSITAKEQKNVDAWNKSLQSAIEAGANILVSGTTVFKSNDGDIKKNINLLKLK